MGAPFYDDDACIDCGMCLANSKDEMIEASKKLREHLRAHAPKNNAIRKIAVCGKGGVGKSTVVTLVTNAIRQKGYNVLVLDTDESNPGLFRMFGFKQKPRALMEVLSRLPSGKKEPDAEWLKPDEFTIRDVPSEYIASSDGIKFLMVGKIEDPFQGCACSMAAVARDLVAKLVMQDNEIMLIDMEAGIESFGRGVERNVDTVLVVVEPSFESISLAERIVYMAQGMGISRAKAILNKVPSENTRQKMEEELEKKGIKTLGTIYYDPVLNEAGFIGTVPATSKATDDINEVVELLFQVPT